MDGITDVGAELDDDDELVVVVACALCLMTEEEFASLDPEEMTAMRHDAIEFLKFLDGAGWTLVRYATGADEAGGGNAG